MENRKQSPPGSQACTVQLEKLSGVQTRFVAKEHRKKIKINPLGGKEDTLYSLFSDERTEVREELSDLLEIP